MRNTQPSDTSQTVSLAEDKAEIKLHGCAVYAPGRLAYWALVVCTAGLVYIASVWFPGVYTRLALRPEPLATASYIRVQQHGKHLALESVSASAVPATAESFEAGFGAPKEHAHNGVLELRAFSFRHYQFILCPSLAVFVAVSQWKDPAWARGAVTPVAGLTSASVSQRMRLFGPCNIDIQEASYMRLLWEEALSPLYIFQVASIIIWCFDDYYYYSAAIFAISVVSITITVVSTKQTARKIREMADYVCLVRVLREGQWSDIASSELVPGDIIDLSGHSFDVAPCDAVLIEGNIIIDESMLTGESVPESKTHMASDDGVLEAIDMAGHTFDPSISRHIIFAGTRVIRARGTPSAYPAVSIDPALNIRATAMVLRTGFCTTKGTLVRSILFPHTTKFRFYRDAIRFLWVLAGIAAVGFVVNTVNLHRMGVPASDIALKALEIITVVVPPALPAAMSIGLVFAARRLRNEGIFCISPTRINVASKVAVMLFDKTGTLTDQGMSMLGVHLANQTHCAFLDMQTEPRALESLAAVLDTGNVVDLIGVPGLSVSSALATCHSLNLVDSALVGDPLEVKMVEFSGWHIEEHDATISQISTAIIACPPQTSLLGASAIVRCFEFAPELRRSSVVTSDQDAHHFAAYVKGAPEVIREICLTETMPGDFDAVLDAHTQCGYRVIALAGKPLKVSADDAQQLKRSDIECNLVFMGFLVFENRLKPVSASVLGELREAHIRTIMCTGDNPLTAVSVARECSLIAPGTTVFVSRLRASTFQDSLCENMFAPLMNVEWKESNGLDVTLDPVTLAPTHANPLDSEATEQAAPYCLAITGNVFAYMEKHAHNTAAWNQVLMRGAVYARMSPEQKAKLVTSLQSIGYCTGFCGDGANDIGALRASDVGISLSEAEASVAAPFTSRVDNISCVVKLLKEGRCSIATGLASFKYMATYSMIQFTTCCILYGYNVNLTNGQYLFIDLFTVLPVAVCVDRFKPFKRLVPKRPSASLTSKKVLTSLLGHTTLIIGFQIGMFLMTKAQGWYHGPQPVTPGDPESTPIQGDLCRGQLWRPRRRHHTPT